MLSGRPLSRLQRTPGGGAVFGCGIAAVRCAAHELTQRGAALFQTSRCNNPNCCERQSGHWDELKVPRQRRNKKAVNAEGLDKSKPGQCQQCSFCQFPLPRFQLFVGDPVVVLAKSSDVVVKNYLLAKKWLFFWLRSYHSTYPLFFSLRLEGTGYRAEFFVFRVCFRIENFPQASFFWESPLGEIAQGDLLWIGVKPLLSCLVLRQ